MDCATTELMWPLPDVFVLTDVEAVKIVRVGFFLLVALGLGESFYHFRFQLHSDVAWQHGQEEPLLLPWTQQGQEVGEQRYWWLVLVLWPTEQRIFPQRSSMK